MTRFADGHYGRSPMPTYEYECQACKAVHEIFHGMSAPRPRKCPSCGKPRLKKLLSGGAGFIFKGDGFYTTDYRSKDYKDAAKKDKEASSAKKSDSKSDSKSASETCKSSGSSDACKSCPSAKKKD